MNKVSLIIKREYITRVRNKRFLLVTFLMPIIFIGFIAGSVYFAASGQEETTTIRFGFNLDNIRMMLSLSVVPRTIESSITTKVSSPERIVP